MVNSGLIIPHSNMETHIIKCIQFGLLNPEEIVKMSVCKVEKTDVSDRDGFPIVTGINDTRMGIVDKTLLCKTCSSNFADCPGHFGHIELARPMYHVGFIETCRKILRCVCYQCSRVLASTKLKRKALEEIKNDKKRQNYMFNICKSTKTCKPEEDDEGTNTDIDSVEQVKMHKTGCGYAQPKYKKDKNDPLRIVMECNDDQNLDNPDRNRVLSAADCLRIFSKISKEDCEVLGFHYDTARPEWMVLTVLAVCPPQVRPSVSVDATLRCEDDLTFMYIQILKANAQLQKYEINGAPNHMIDESISLLQFYIATLMNNEISTATSQQRSGRPIKAISTRLKGKEGRLRGNLMGKRVDFSARTVITPDPNLSLDQLGVPRSLALNLTFPEVVTPKNIDHLRRLIENGPTEWPGAKYIISDDGIRRDLRYIKYFLF